MTDKGTSGQSVQKSPELTEGLFLMDGIEGLRSLPRHSVDMLLTDPPYGTTRNFWDVPLPLPELWEAVKWAVKPDGAILFFAQCPYDKVLGASNLSMLRYEWVWYKSRSTGFLNARRAPLKKTENILVWRSNADTTLSMSTATLPFARCFSWYGRWLFLTISSRRAASSMDLWKPTVIGNHRNLCSHTMCASGNLRHSSGPR